MGGRHRPAGRAQRRGHRDDRGEDPASAGGKPTVSATPGGAERVLIVDDEPDILALCSYHLARAGYRVSTAATGPEGLRAAREERPGLIVLDLMLPEMSGFEILERLRSDDATRGIAVLMLTARREEPDRIRRS